MKPEEAIGIVKTEKKCVMRNICTACSRNCYDCDLLLPDEQILTGYDTAIAALKKQIPKEPVTEIKQGMTFYKCPECGRAIFSAKYCAACGQAIKREG